MLSVITNLFTISCKCTAWNKYYKSCEEVQHKIKIMSCEKIDTKIFFKLNWCKLYNDLGVEMNGGGFKNICILNMLKTLKEKWT